MCLDFIAVKSKQNQYKTVTDFRQDVHKMRNNCRAYNAVGLFKNPGKALCFPSHGKV